MSEKSGVPALIRRTARHRGAAAGMVLLSLFLLAAAFAPVISPGDPLAQKLDEGLSGPSASHRLGQDKFGRDVLSRLIHGARLSLAVGLGTVGRPLPPGAPRRVAGRFPRRRSGPDLHRGLRRPAGVPGDPARHRHRRRARPLVRERPLRPFDPRVGGVRTGDPRAGALRQNEGVRRVGPRGGKLPGAPPPAAHPPQCALPDPRGSDLRDRPRDRRGGGAFLPRPGRRPAGAVVGVDDRRGAALPLRRAAPCHRSRGGDPSHGHGVQLRGGRASGRPRPQAGLTHILFHAIILIKYGTEGGRDESDRRGKGAGNDSQAIAGKTRHPARDKTGLQGRRGEARGGESERRGPGGTSVRLPWQKTENRCHDPVAQGASVITAVDTNVLLDVFGADATHGIRSANALRGCLREGALVACEAVWAETAVAFPGEKPFLDAMRAIGVTFSPIEEPAALRASASWRLYRSRGGKRERVVADFLIGAHALVQCDRILTRDRGFYRDYFRELTIVDQAEHSG